MQSLSQYIIRVLPIFSFTLESQNVIISIQMRIFTIWHRHCGCCEIYKSQCCWYIKCICSKINFESYSTTQIEHFCYSVTNGTLKNCSNLSGGIIMLFWILPEITCILLVRYLEDFEIKITWANLVSWESSHYLCLTVFLIVTS